ncbi:MAG: hypothetical protein NC299_15340 [Lachnospiraceae bacterium]|nr:hypothetical protein [Ruminococcus sp.]MCM1276708.1 hypothetical protein [Lachnospiraceae bacterium]
MYIYPDNLKAAPMLFLWRLKDLAVIGIGALISVLAWAKLGFSLPLIGTLVYAFLAIRFDGTSILDFLKYAVRYFFIEQQEYRWKI